MDEMKGHGHPGGDSDRGHETRDMDVRPIAIFVLGLFVFVSVTLVLMGGLFDYFATRQTRFDVPPSPLATRELPPEPRLQVTPPKELREVQAAEDTVLNSYGWVDRKAGIVRIPIGQAMELLATRGLPARAQRQGED